MAGTHTRNPIKLAATLAILTEIKKRSSTSENKTDESNSCFLQELNEKTRLMCEELNSFFKTKNVPLIIEYFSSLFRFKFLDDPNGVVKELVFVLMRINGVETSPSGNCFLTLAHSDKDIKSIIRVVKKSIDTLMKQNFFYISDSIEEDEIKEDIRSTISTIPDMRNDPEQESIKNDQMEKLRKLIISDLNNFQEKEVTI